MFAGSERRRIDEWQTDVLVIGAGAAGLRAALDLESMLLTADATVRSARLRTESRGAHQRRDYPATSPAWQRTIVAGLGSNELILSTEALAEPSPEVAGAIAATAELAVAGRLLE